MEMKFDLSKLVWKDALPFTKKRDVKWSFIGRSLAIALVGVVVLVLFLPAPRKDQKIFYEKSDGRAVPADTKPDKTPYENNPTEDTLAQLQSAKGQAGAVPKSIPALSGNSANGGTSGQTPNRNSAMVIARGGLDSKTQLPPGTKIPAQLDQSMTLDNHSVPIIATVGSDVVQEDGTAIPQGAKLYGDASLDTESERVQVNWKSIQLPNGAMKPLAAIAIGADGQVGIEGIIHSDAVKNTVGQTLTNFIGAYAQGSMQTGMFGQNPGGSENGLKNAIAQTAQNRASSMAENMKKERTWCELQAGASLAVVLTQSFQFRDPGATYGR